MSKSKRRRPKKRVAEQVAELQTPESVWHGRRLTIVVTAIFIVLIILIVVINQLFSEDQKYYRIDVITVDGISVRMDKFVRRCHAAGSDPMSMLTSLSREIIIQKEAELLELEPSDEAIDQKLREMAQGGSEGITESEFREWYRQRLNDSGLSDKEFREITATAILSEYFRELISSVTPTTAEQVHLHIILLDTEDDALDAIARLEAGENFADLASELSMDTASGENGGDIGWIPRGVALDSRYDDIIFSLDVGEISEPMPLYNSSVTDPASPALVNYYLFLVSEKADDREINEEYLDTVYDNAYSDWINYKMQEYDIHYRGINGNFDSTTYSWINWQLQKLNE
jgi:hypothetical protein